MTHKPTAAAFQRVRLVVGWNPGSTPTARFSGLSEERFRPAVHGGLPVRSKPFQAPFTGLLAVSLERLTVLLASKLKPDIEKPRERG
jgi:hypothetical protein